ncbi:MAG: hypothetical protein B7L53_09815 [Thermofilum sp. NZ13]|nr:MAG: hypothetical protein B7L53_09815 [Thermofilum sp. NZ13]
MKSLKDLEELAGLAGDPGVIERLEVYLGKLRELLSSPKLAFSPEAPVPSKPGVYIVWRGREVIYVGSSSDLRRRILGDHLQGNVRGSRLRRALSWDLGLADPAEGKARLSREQEEKISGHLRERCALQFIVEEDERRRAMLEHFAIALLSPRLVSPMELPGAGRQIK